MIVGLCPVRVTWTRRVPLHHPASDEAVNIYGLILNSAPPPPYSEPPGQPGLDGWVEKRRRTWGETGPVVTGNVP